MNKTGGLSLPTVVPMHTSLNNWYILLNSCGTLSVDILGTD